MPTKRGWGLFLLALILYFLANQTQVGWVYIITDGLIGLLLVTAIYSWGMLKAITVTRFLYPVPVQATDPAPEAKSSRSAGRENAEFDLSPPAFHEDDPIEVTLYVGQTLYIPSYYGGGQYDKGGYNNGNNWGGYKDDGYGYNSQYHVVRRGETLSYIAYCYGVNMWSLAQANNIHNVNHVHSGQRLYIPNY
jgi:hypothetical protein